MSSNSPIPIKLLKSTLGANVKITLPASKSISNRALIINALCQSAGEVENLSSARDTQTMLRLLSSEVETLDVLDAGTTMRFLVAYITATHQQKILTGTDRMQQRPIGILVDAMLELGADITYLNKAGYPPIQINGFKQKTNEIKIRGDVSSQYISALLMIAPSLDEGLKLTLEGHVGSRPYIEMTLKIMQQFGIQYSWNDNMIAINPQEYIQTPFRAEGDWSGASYWYSFVALSDNGSVLLDGMTEESLQGDQAIAEIMESLGVHTTYSEEGALLTKIDHQSTYSYDFAHSPDLAQTIAVVCAVKGIHAIYTGLESLKIKETDRVLALQTELAKFGATLKEEEDTWTLVPSENLPAKVDIHTYEDHRMAMAFAPLCLVMDVSFDDASVVNKSYPSFWEDVKNSVS